MGRYEIMEINNERISWDSCPIVVDRYVINNDHLGDRLFLQIRFQNIGAKEIQSFCVELLCSDAKDSLCFEHEYSDLNFKAGEVFGIDELIPLPDRLHTDIKISCKRISFKSELS